MAAAGYVFLFVAVAQMFRHSPDWKLIGGIFMAFLVHCRGDRNLGGQGTRRAGTSGMDPCGTSWRVYNVRPGE